MAYFTAKNAQQVTHLSKKEKRRLSRRIKQIAKAGYDYAQLNNAKDFSMQYKKECVKWLTELGFICTTDEDNDTIKVYWRERNE